jgi:hypothetical protein
MDDLGYGVVEGVFSGAELAPVVAALDGHLDTRSRAGARHVGARSGGWLGGEAVRRA